MSGATVTIPKWSVMQADAARLPLADDSVQLVFTSPPYLCARTYGISAQRDCQAWIDWMLTVVAECCRVCSGLVLVNCAGVTRDWRYRPGPEGLLYEWWKRGGECWRPCYWHRVGIPGSGGKQWLRADVEYVLAFKAQPGKIAWSDNTACGHPPKWGPGGEMSHRVNSGARVNQWGHPINTGGTTGSMDAVTCGAARPSHTVFGSMPSVTGSRPNGKQTKGYFNGAWSKQHTKSNADGSDVVQTYNVPVKANPGNLIKTVVGGGVMGHKLAHENEAPFPVALAEFFIKSFCPPDAITFDPFCGSGTTLHAAIINGRRAMGSDLRASQCDLTTRRMLDVERTMREPVKAKRARRQAVVPGVPTLFDTDAA